MTEVHDFLKSFHGGRALGEAVVKADGFDVKKFDESKHPRDHGKFAHNQGESGSDKNEEGTRKRGPLEIGGNALGVAHTVVSIPDSFKQAKMMLEGNGANNAKVKAALILAGTTPLGAYMAQGLYGIAGRVLDNVVGTTGMYDVSRKSILGKFDESKHPREGKGSEHGGEFASEGGSGEKAGPKSEESQPRKKGNNEIWGAASGGAYGSADGLIAGGLIGGMLARNPVIGALAGGAAGAVAGYGIGSTIGGINGRMKDAVVDNVLKSDSGDLAKFGTWDESKHPRDHGKFAHSNTAAVAGGIAAGAAAIGGAYLAARKGHLGQMVQGSVMHGELIAGEHAAAAGRAIRGAADAAGARLNTAVSNTGIAGGFKSGQAGMGVRDAYSAGGAGAAIGAGAAHIGEAARTAGVNLRNTAQAGYRSSAAGMGVRDAYGAGGSVAAGGAIAQRVSSGVQRGVRTAQVSGARVSQKTRQVARGARTGLQQGAAGNSARLNSKSRFATGYNTGAKVGNAYSGARSYIGGIIGR